MLSGVDSHRMSSASSSAVFLRHNSYQHKFQRPVLREAAMLRNSSSNKKSTKQQSQVQLVPLRDIWHDS